MKRFIEFASFCKNLKVCHNLPGMHARNNIPSTGSHFQWFFYTCISQAHISFHFFLWRIAIVLETYSY